MRRGIRSIVVPLLLLTLLVGIVGVDGSQTPVTVTFWTTETKPNRVAIQEEIASDFMALHPDIKVEVVPVLESEMPAKVAAASSAGDLPDVMIVPDEYVISWAKDEILDIDANSTLLEKLGVNTFATTPRDVAKVEGDYVAIPLDGWAMLFLGRKDMTKHHLFHAEGNWRTILLVAVTLNEATSLYGLEVGTDCAERFMQQVFEQFALSNGARLVDMKGNINLKTVEFADTLKVYKLLASTFTPSGKIKQEQIRDDYFAGRAAMILWPSLILDELAGLENSVPVTKFPAGTPALHERTFIGTGFSGPLGSRVQYGQVNYLGITKDADTEAAQAFAEYLLSDGYTKWLSMDPLGKLPMRPGYIDVWKELDFGVDRKAKISAVYGAEVLSAIASGVNNIDRWGIGTGRGQCVRSIYDKLTIVKILRDYIDGKFATAELAAAEMDRRVRALPGCEDRQVKP